MTVLQALSLTGGCDESAAPRKAKLLRPSGSGQRSEIPVDVKAILEGKTPDVTMYPEDILFIPSRGPAPPKHFDPPLPGFRVHWEAQTLTSQRLIAQNVKRV